MSFMIDRKEDVPHIGRIGDSVEKRRELALASFKYNLGNPEFVKLFPELTDSSKYNSRTGFSMKTELFPLQESPPLRNAGCESRGGRGTECEEGADRDDKIRTSRDSSRSGVLAGGCLACNECRV